MESDVVSKDGDVILPRLSRLDQGGIERILSLGDGFECKPMFQAKETALQKKLDDPQALEAKAPPQSSPHQSLVDRLSSRPHDGDDTDILRLEELEIGLGGTKGSPSAGMLKVLKEMIEERKQETKAAATSRTQRSSPTSPITSSSPTRRSSADVRRPFKYVGFKSPQHSSWRLQEPDC